MTIRESDEEHNAIMYSIAREVCRIHDVPWRGDGTPLLVEYADLGDRIRADKNRWDRDE